MKLLFISNVYPTPWEPNRGTFNRGLMDALAAAGHEVRCVVPIGWIDRMRAVLRRAPRFPTDSRATFRAWFYPPGLLRSHYHRFMGAAIRPVLQRVTRGWNPDAVLSFWIHPDAAVALRFARERGIPLLAFAGGSDLLVITRDPARRRAVAGVLREADALFTDGNHLRDFALTLEADPARTWALYRGVDPALFSPGDRGVARQQLSIDPDARLLLAVGNLVSVKGIDVLLRALQEISNTAPWQLALVGDGTVRRALESQAEAAGLADQVRFVGRVAHGELATWYRAADLLVLPSRSEGVPNVLLEALACGLPFVASRVGGVPEIAPDESWLVPPGDVPALSAALLRRYRQVDARHPAQQFDWNIAAQLVTGVLEKFRSQRNDGPSA